MHPILCIYPFWYDSVVIVKRQWGVMAAFLAKPMEKIAWNERDIEMWETRGALGRLATKSLNFFDKRRDKSVACLSVCEPDRERRLWRDDECMILHTSERMSDGERQTDRDRGRMNEWYQGAHSGTEDSHWHPLLLLGSEFGVSMSMCAQILSFEKTISPDAGLCGFDRHQEVPSILQSQNMCVCTWVYIYIWVVCIMYLLPMKC